MTVGTLFALILLLAGTFFVAVAAVGVMRLPDLYTRMHAAAKAGAFGGSLILLAVLLVMASWAVSFKIVLIVLFFYASTPVASHMIGRAAYFTGIKAWKKNRIDEMADHHPHR